MRRLLPALLLAACATTGSALDLTTIRVTNEGLDALKIYEDGHRVGSVGPGQSVCVVIRRPSLTVLVARAVGGGSVQSVPMDTNSHSWTWTVRRLDQFDTITPIPTGRC